MAKRFVFSFAFSGDKVTVPDGSQGNGAVSYQEGYGARYSLDVDTDPTARRINREPYNQVLSDVTENLKEWQEQFAPDFITPVNNGGAAFAYPLGMVVWNGTAYRRSTSGNNTSDVSDNNNWEDYDFGTPSLATETAAGISEIATQTETGAGTDDARLVTPLKLATRLGQLGSAPWVNQTSSFAIATGQRYLISATTSATDATLPATVTVGLPIVVHNNADSTELVRIVNSGHTIFGRGQNITPADNLILQPGDTAFLVGRAVNQLEAV